MNHSEDRHRTGFKEFIGRCPEQQFVYDYLVKMETKTDSLFPQPQLTTILEDRVSKSPKFKYRALCICM